MTNKSETYVLGDTTLPPGYTPPSALMNPDATVAPVPDARAAGEKAQAAPTFFEQMLAVLPDHAHIVSTPFRWSATWSTPGGVWTIKSRIEPLVMTTVRITGPDTKIVRYADAQPLVGVLRALGALSCTEECGEGHTYEPGCQLAPEGRLSRSSR